MQVRRRRPRQTARTAQFLKPTGLLATTIGIRFAEKDSSEALPQTDQTCFGILEHFDRQTDRHRSGRQLHV